MLRSLARVVLIAGCACTLPNPAFEPPGGGVDGSDGGSSTGGDDGPAATTTTTSDGPDPTSTAGDPGTSTASLPVGCAGDGECDDGVFCNGAERCALDTGTCVAGPAPCQPGTTCQESTDACAAPCEVDADADDDGFAAVACGGDDCDDGDAGVHPGQSEVCDPGAVDEDCDPATVGGDGDGDGLVDSACCNLTGDGSVCGLDCDDSSPGIQQAGDDWAHCQGCGMPCGAQQACIAGACFGARRVFTTSSSFTADFGGVAGADAACQAHADAAALGGSFRAYMLTLDDGFARLQQPNVMFARLDGVIVAMNWAQLAARTGDLEAPMALDEHRLPTQGKAWTGIGEGLDFTCDDWTTSEHGCLGPNKPCAVAGESTETDTDWNGQYLFHCDDKYRLYCLEQ